ncbi:MAG: hypothetical protein FIB01_07985 [Gemmatimonadetes bacterium]|nr:hypothetical protein [Gemmatimonadota bacterium]
MCGAAGGGRPGNLHRRGARGRGRRGRGRGRSAHGRRCRSGPGVRAPRQCLVRAGSEPDPARAERPGAHGRERSGAVQPAQGTG